MEKITAKNIAQFIVVNHEPESNTGVYVRVRADSVWQKVPRVREVIKILEDKLIEHFSNAPRLSSIKGFSLYHGAEDCIKSDVHLGSISIRAKVGLPYRMHTISYDIARKEIQINSFGPNDEYASSVDIMSPKLKQFVEQHFPQSSYNGFVGCNNTWGNIDLEQFIR
ncbi:MAG: hypothetical protein QS98_C0010G0065 [archaeon GW2011_AR3]|nr:MAG: hypothetical protein QS98_C0010G0065 [archaeon GW2011_AR3]MBS3110203.1 hypothetical protein [Candidatus Woesearchaeota archaeon]